MQGDETITAQPVGRRSVERKLHRAWRKERRFHHTRGLFNLLLWVAVLILLDLVVDWLFLLSGRGRIALLAINAAAMLAVLHRQWWRHLRRFDAVRVALQVENRHPELQSVLVSYVQFGGDGPLDDRISPVLIRALRREAVRTTQPVDFREIVNYRQLSRIGLFCCAVLLFFGGVSVNWTEFLRTLLYRMMDPSASREYPTRTKIDRVIAEDTLRQGDPFHLEVICSGLVPSRGRLYYTPEGGQRESVPIGRNAEGHFVFSREAVYQGFSFHLRIGDDESRTYEVKVIPPPRVVQARVHVVYPPYTRMGAKDFTSLNLDVPEGSELSWVVRCDRALGSAEMLIEGETPLPLKLDSDARTASVTLRADKTIYYRFQWTDREHRYPYAGDLQYYVQVIPDTPPVVDLLEPLEDEKATLRKKLTVHYRAMDDYAIAEARIVYRVNEGREWTHKIAAPDSPSVDSRYPWTLTETIPGLKVGDVVTYALEVADSRADKQGPNVSRTRPLRVAIVNLADYLRYIYEKKAKLIQEMEALQKEETEASDEVKTIRTDSLSTTQPASETTTRPASPPVPSEP